jgi:hypothetical protein
MASKIHQITVHNLICYVSSFLQHLLEVIYWQIKFMLIYVSCLIYFVSE